MPFDPFAAGETLTAAKLNAGLDNVARTVYQTADSPPRNNSTAYLDSTTLVMALEANAGYIIDSFIIYDTNSTADFKIRFTVPSGGFIRMAKWGQDTGASAVAGSINVQAIDDTSDAVEFTLGGVASGTMMTARPSGIIAVGATPGNLQVAFSQNTATAINTVLKLGSWVALSRVL